ncbi:FAD-binding oxidoreductase [Amycolatopsis azurea]|uniref:FAD-binding oxidoreductase n=1 Tax=Amycolatopsis azurea TaxID=36819 RepID=UPI0038225186
MKLPNLITDPNTLAGLSHDEAEWAPAGTARAAVRPRSTRDVQEAAKACAAEKIPIVPRGAGTGLSGGANAVDGCLVLDLSRMNRILEIDADNLLAVVQPGVVNDDLKKAVAEQGLWYPPDPASSPWSTIGGNVATNAGGLCCLKYGVTRDYVLGLEAVMGGPVEYGTAVRLGRRTSKGVAGYDLTSLLVGSEGTLGVVTEISVRLRPAPGPSATIVGAFPDLVTAGQAVALATSRGLQPAALELIDRACLQAVEDWKHLGIEPDTAAMLLARAETHMDADGLVSAFTDAGAVWAERSTDSAEAEALFAARRLVYPALERLGPLLTEDVCVPRSRVPEMLARIEKIGARHGVQIATIAHAGDGNLHPLLITPPGDDNARLASQSAFDDIITHALDLGGTVTAEHGVGLLKRDGMIRELGHDAWSVQKAIKHTLDPLNIFNPGKA